MPLTITDFVEQVEGLTVEDISEKNRERINDALANVTGGEGGEGAGPVNDDAAVVSNEIENATVGIVRGDTDNPSSSQISGNTFSNVNTDIRSISSGVSSGN